LIVNNFLSLSNGSTTIIEISRDSGSPTNDAVAGVTTFKFGGTLLVTNIGATALMAGDTFQLFSAMTYNGSFATTNLPPLGNNLYWTNTLGANGQLAVVAAISLVPTNLIASLSGTNLILSWPSDHTGWRLLMQTNNLAGGISSDTNDWTPLPASQTTNQLTLPLDGTKPVEFYRLVYP
jgi:hypothetical protein